MTTPKIIKPLSGRMIAVKRRKKRKNKKVQEIVHYYHITHRGICKGFIGFYYSLNFLFLEIIQKAPPVLIIQLTVAMSKTPKAQTKPRFRIISFYIVSGCLIPRCPLRNRRNAKPPFGGFDSGHRRKSRCSRSLPNRHSAGEGRMKSLAQVD